MLGHGLRLLGLGLLWGLAPHQALTPCGSWDLRPFFSTQGLNMVLDQTDRQLVQNCSNAFGISELVTACRALQPKRVEVQRMAQDAALLHAHICSQPRPALRERLKVCLGVSDRTLSMSASADAVRAHLLFCNHHYTCSLEVLRKDCEDQRFWTVQRLGEVCFPPALKGETVKVPMYEQALHTCEATHGRSLREIVTSLKAQVDLFGTTGRMQLPPEEVDSFRQHLLALTELQQAKREAIAQEQEREALLLPDPEEDPLDEKLPPLDRPTTTRPVQGMFKPTGNAFYSVV
mmetsp:Transcript_35502/g.63453  ORF Transcript_35502/g.63453 Transcript_35502/m.63453 type:complete len:290 (-) Transcript_35502:162-1031(-)